VDWLIKENETAPLVSIITPFYNTEAYLAECIESVLAQSYRNWEYILVNNQSTDGSRAICERYARMEKRIRLIDTSEHYSQVQNFEGALKQMSPQSKYCKMVLADDWLFPDCVKRMVCLAEANPNVGIVSAYRLLGNEVVGSGLPYTSTVVPGREAGRLMLTYGYYLTGSPTSILVRADLVRKTDRFYESEWIHDDTEACLRILAQHDLGFIHHVLTFSRADNDSITASLDGLNPGLLRKYLFAKQYGADFLNGRELEQLIRAKTDEYGAFLAASVFEFKGRSFWDFHRRGLQSAGFNLRSMGLGKYISLELFDLILNPKKTAGRLFRAIKNRRERLRPRRYGVHDASE
jgi:glycosyltransferase involved in cell wall biosynthesis